MIVHWLWLIIYAYLSFIPCVNYLLHEFWDTYARMDRFETQLRLAPAREVGCRGDLFLASDTWSMCDPHGFWSGRSARFWSEQHMCIVGQTCITTSWHHNHCICITFDLIFVCECGIYLFVLYCGFDLIAPNWELEIDYWGIFEHIWQILLIIWL